MKRDFTCEMPGVNTLKILAVFVITVKMGGN